MGAKNQIGIDSFLYFDFKGEIKHFNLVEVNYRKTMGIFLHSLKRFLPKNGIGKWYIFPNKDAPILDYQKNNFKDLIILNDCLDKKIPFLSYFIIAQDKPDLLKKEEKYFSNYQLPHFLLK